MRQRTSQRLSAGQPVFRGERRLIIPTPEMPDPATADPRRVVTHLLTNRFGRSDPLALSEYQSNRPDETVGVHWSTDNRVIPQRFTEMYNGGQSIAQPGVQMSDDERHGIRLTDLNDNANMRHDRLLRQGRSSWSADRAAAGRVLAHDIIGNNNPWKLKYRDLSGEGQFAGASPSTGAAAPYLAQVIWEGRHNPAGIGTSDEYSTDFESEITYEEDSPIEITAARVAKIPRSGEEFGNPYKDIWNRVQFDQPIQSRIGGSSISSQIAEQGRKR
jgi:hypothetical protein